MLPLVLLAALAAPLTVRTEPGRVTVQSGMQPLATYRYDDPAILRPYLCDVFTTDGHRVTRNLPPIEGRDAVDHPTMHPGLWLAFGDLGGTDFWRNKGRVVHENFMTEPRAEGDGVSWAVANRYEAGDRTICREVSRLSFAPRPGGYLVVWAAEFSPADGEVSFGDQEEMGFGLRVATSLAVKTGGQILASHGGENERGTWGRTADWCDYRGTVQGDKGKSADGADRIIGATLMPDPQNFRPSWFHARDYGLLVANPFGRRAFKQGEASRVPVPLATPLRLRFGVYIHSTAPNDPPDLPAEYRAFVATTFSPRN